MTAITAFLAAWGIELVGGAVGAVAIGWILGKGVSLPVAKSLFDKLARMAGRAGLLVDAFGKRKLGAAISNPLEDLLYQLVGRPCEEFWAKLRQDNPAKLEKYKAGLEAVESKTRLKAITDKIEEMAKHPAPMQTAEDAAMLHRMNQFTTESAKRKLGG